MCHICIQIRENFPTVSSNRTSERAANHRNVRLLIDTNTSIINDAVAETHNIHKNAL